jgi:hypothetical protein
MIVRKIAGGNSSSIDRFLRSLIRGRDRIEQAIDARLQLR